VVDYLQQGVDGIKLGLEEAASTQHAERMFHDEEFTITFAFHYGIEFNTQYIEIAINSWILIIGVKRKDISILSILWYFLQQLPQICLVLLLILRIQLSAFHAIWKSEVLNDVGSLLDLRIIWSLWVGEDLLG
jgi:hypothetical protein